VLCGIPDGIFCYQGSVSRLIYILASFNLIAPLLDEFIQSIYTKLAMRRSGAISLRYI